MTKIKKQRYHFFIYDNDETIIKLMVWKIVRSCNYYFNIDVRKTKLDYVMNIRICLAYELCIKYKIPIKLVGQKICNQNIEKGREEKAIRYLVAKYNLLKDNDNIVKISSLIRHIVSNNIPKDFSIFNYIYFL